MSKVLSVRGKIILSLAAAGSEIIMRRPAVSKQNFLFGGKRICPYTDGTIMQMERKSEQCTTVIISHVVLISISLWFNSMYETQRINVYMFQVVHILEPSTHPKSSESSTKSKEQFVSTYLHLIAIFWAVL